jgi:prophage antirepressor-like protein
MILPTFNKIFDYMGKSVRSVHYQGEPWFVAKDICDVLGISNTHQAVSRLDDDEKDVCSTYTLGGLQDALIVSRPGMCTIILQSRKPAAKPFLRWVTHEVLESIWKTGTYTYPHVDWIPATDRGHLAATIIELAHELGCSKTDVKRYKFGTVANFRMAAMRDQPGVLRSMRRELRCVADLKRKGLPVSYQPASVVSLAKRAPRWL